MKLLSLSVSLGLLASISSAAPTGLMLDGSSFNETLFSSRSLEKREVFFTCNNQAFSGPLAQAIEDAKNIMSNMVDHLELAINLYDEDGSGRLKESKNDKSKRTFDEHNAFASYAMFITKHYWGDRLPDSPERNKDGLERLKGTRDLASTMVSQYENYLAGQPVRWVRGGFPYITIYCDDGDVLSARNSNGLTYTEDTGYRNPYSSNGKVHYKVSQAEGTQLNRREVWVSRSAVCALQEGDGQMRFGGVPAKPSINAYVYPAAYDLVEETMFFCPVRFDRWIATDTSRTGAGLHYRDLHVEIGASPSDAQNTAIDNLLASPDFTDEQAKGITWLSEFLTSTMIHESTHSEAFIGSGNRLIDVKCANGATTTSPGCMYAIAKGAEGLDSAGNPQGHKDAEAFAIYAMAMWVNTVHWFRYKPARRETYR